MVPPNKLLLGLFNLAQNCRSNRAKNHTEDKILTSVGVVFRFRPQSLISESDLRKCLTLIERVSIEDLSESDRKNFENSLTLPFIDDSLEFVMCKRAERGKDYDRGQLCLPGGHVDPGENEQQACIREISEEIGYDVSDKSKFICLGKLFEGLHAFYMKGKQTTITLYVFIQTTFDDLPIKTNPGEITEAYWIQFADFWTFNINRLLLNTLTKEGSESILKSYTSLPHAYIDESLENDKNYRLKIWAFQLPKIKFFFWGLTYYSITMLLEGFVFGGGNSILDFEETLKTKLFITRANTLTTESSDKKFEALVNHDLTMNQNTISLGIIRQKL